MACNGLAPVTKNGTAPTAVITTGKDSSYDINMLTVPGGTTCSLTLTVTDINAANATATGTLQVWSSVEQRQPALFKLIISGVHPTSCSLHIPAPHCCFPPTPHLRIPQVAPLGPVAALAGAPALSVVAGSSAVLNASGSACYNGPCNTTFVVDCGSKNITRSGPDTTTTLTTGFGSGVDLDMKSAPSLTCGVTVTLTNANGAEGTATATLQVTLRPTWAA